MQKKWVNQASAENLWCADFNFIFQILIRFSILGNQISHSAEILKQVKAAVTHGCLAGGKNHMLKFSGW